MRVNLQAAGPWDAIDPSITSCPAEWQAMAAILRFVLSDMVASLVAKPSAKDAWENWQSYSQARWAMARPAIRENSEVLGPNWAMIGNFMGFPLYWPAHIFYCSSATAWEVVRRSRAWAKTVCARGMCSGFFLRRDA